MQTFENLILQNCSTELYNIPHTHGPCVCNLNLFKWWCHLDFGLCDKVCSSGYNNNVKLYNITIIVHYNV